MRDHKKLRVFAPIKIREIEKVLNGLIRSLRDNSLQPSVFRLKTSPVQKEIKDYDYETKP